MENTFLPGTVRQRLADIMKIRKVSQTELAQRIGCQDSTISRFISGKTDKLSDKNLIRTPKVVYVSLSFIFGVTPLPDRKNYDIDALGLSQQAARNLYTGKVNTQVVNRLLESPRFAELTYILEQYFDDTLAAGYAAQNQMYATLSSLTRKTVKSDAANQTAKKILQMRTPVYQADLTTIENQFMLAVKEVKKEIGNDYATAQALTVAAAERMFAELTKGQDMENPTVTPEQVTELIIGSVAGMDGVDQEALDKLGQALTGFMQTTLDQAAAQEKGNEKTEQ